MKLKNLTAKQKRFFLVSVTSSIAASNSINFSLEQIYSIYVIKQEASVVLQKWEMRMYKTLAAQLQKVLNT